MGRRVIIDNGLADIDESRITTNDDGSINIDANELFYKDLNILLKQTIQERQPGKVSIKNVYGQRYIGTNLKQKIELNIYGTPGNDLGAFMDGPVIHVFGNAQDVSGNTMNSGEIVVHGSAGDVVGFSARGGEIFVKGNVGYRVGIHMKEYKDQKPTLIIGGTAQDFLGEYMAGGRLIVLGLDLDENEYHKSDFIGTGMHGGVIYLRGKVEDYQLGKEVSQVEPDGNDMDIISNYVVKFAEYFGNDVNEILDKKFIKLLPLSHRPYGNLYAY